MQPFQDEQGDQGSPNLDAECVLASADEGLHGQVLLERFEQLSDILPINNALLKSRFTTIFIRCARTAYQ